MKIVVSNHWCSIRICCSCRHALAQSRGIRRRLCLNKRPYRRGLACSAADNGWIDV